MRWYYKWRTRLKNWLRFNKQHDELAAEIEQHIELSVANLVSSGMDPREARKMALREFGNVEALKEECQDSWGMRFIDTAIRHVHYAGRQMRENKSYTAVVVLTLGIGIGMNTMIFAFANGLKFKPPSFPNGDRLCAINGQDFKRNNRLLGSSYPDFIDFRDQNSTFEFLEAVDYSFAVISDAERPASGYSMALVSPGLIRMLESAPIVGRPFSPEDYQVGATPVLLIGYELWRNRFNEDPNVIDLSIRLNGKPAQIIGVMPEDFRFPNGQEIWMPLVPVESLQSRDNRTLRLYGVMKRSESLSKANADIATIAHRIASKPDANSDIGAVVKPFQDQFNDDESFYMLVVMQLCVGLVLLIACSNVANLQLGRAIKRKFEMNVRTAIGASRPQLIRQLLTESFLLSLLAGSFSLIVSKIGVHFFERSIRDQIPYWMHFTLDYRDFAFLVAVTFLSTALFGLAPAIRISKTELNSGIKESAQSGGSARGSKLMGTLVVFQFALTVVLLASASFMIHGTLEARKINDFIPEDEILTSQIDLRVRGSNRYSTPSERRQFFDELSRRVYQLPGVTHVAFSSSFAGMTDSETNRIEIEDRPISDPREADLVYTCAQSSNFLSAIELPIWKGRGFLDTDGLTGEPVSVVSKQFAERFWPEQSAVGKRFRFLAQSGPGPWRTIVGVTFPFSVKMRGESTLPMAFTAQNEEVRRHTMIHIRSTNDPHSYTQSLREIVKDLDQDLILYSIETVAEGKAQNNWPWVVSSTLFVSFAAAALAMASLGVYSVVAQSAANKTRELGIRKALGATTRNIQGQALSTGFFQLAIGLTIGGSIVFAIAQFSQDALGKLMPYNAILLYGVITLLLAIGLLACWLPARKASLVNPSDTLRAE